MRFETQILYSAVVVNWMGGPVAGATCMWPGSLFRNWTKLHEPLTETMRE